MTRRRRRFTAEFKAQVALRGDRTIQDIAAKHQVHPNQISGWKRQAIDGLQELFAGGAKRRQADHETTIHDLHAKIGELTVERDSLSRGPTAEARRATDDDRSRPRVSLSPQLHAARAESFGGCTTRRCARAPRPWR